MSDQTIQNRSVIDFKQSQRGWGLKLCSVQSLMRKKNQVI